MTRSLLPKCISDRLGIAQQRATEAVFAVVSRVAGSLLVHDICRETAIADLNTCDRADAVLRRLGGFA